MSHGNGKHILEVTERKSQPAIKVLIRGSRKEVRYAWRDDQGRIVFDRPEHVPRLVRDVLVPDLFRKIDRHRLGIA